MEDVYPRPLTSKVQAHMDRIANAILEYREVTGDLPPAPNAAMVRALQGLNPRVFFLRELNAQGEVVDPWGQPYVYVVPGVDHHGQFDLYSIGRSGKGATDPSARDVCEPFRI